MLLCWRFYSVSVAKKDVPIEFPPTDNAFSIEAASYTTPNAYLILDDGPAYTNGYAFAFLAGQLREDNVNSSSMSTDGNRTINGTYQGSVEIVNEF